MQNKLAVKDTIRSRKAKYCRLIDEKKWTEVTGLLMERPSIQFFGSGGLLENEYCSAETFVDATRGLIEGADTIHQVHNGEIEVLSDNEVRAIWSVEDFIVFPDGDHRVASINGYGHCHETWQFVDGAWRLATLVHRRTILIIKTKDQAA